MAMSLRLTDGATTVYLTQGNATLLAYVPRTGVRDQPLTESARVVYNVAVATAKSDLDSLTRLFQAASRYQRRQIGPQVFVEFKAESGDDYYRSQVFAGRVDLHDEATGIQYLTAVIEATIAWTREPFWEASAETELALANGNEASPGTPATGGLTLFNANDGTGSTPNLVKNWVKVAAAAALGDLPAPLRLEFTNSTAGDPRVRHVYAAQSVIPDPANQTLLFEAEAATGATPVVDATCSGGNYASYTLTATETAAFTWALSAAQMDAFAGGRFMALIRLRAILPAATLLRLRLVSNAVTLWQAPFQTTGGTADFLQAIGTVQLPPGISKESLAVMSLAITAYRAAASGTFSLDYMFLMPVGDAVDDTHFGGYRKYSPKTTYGLLASTALIDDSLKRPPEVGTRPGAKFLPDYYASGNGPFLLWPNALQYYYFLWDTTDAAALPARKASVRLYTRFRRRTI